MPQTMQNPENEILYILDPPKPPTNGLGIAGFTLGILGLFTFGLLSPIGLILSFFGLFKKPRGFAAAGFAMSLIGISFISAVTALPVIAHRHRQVAHALEAQQQQTLESIREAVQEVEISRSTGQSQGLDGFEGNAITIRFQDAWENDLRFDERSDGFAVRSAGPDRTFDTPDDLVQISSIKRKGIQSEGSRFAL
jgi:hypothetical protein